MRCGGWFPRQSAEAARRHGPLAARFASARAQARRAPIRVTAIERELGTTYTADTLQKLRRRYPITASWIMGADNLAQFHQWKRWRAIARAMPIAVVARPGYDGAAVAAPAMAWLRRFRRNAASLRQPAGWSAPSLVLLRFDPDPRSASALRAADPGWADGLPARMLRDSLTRKIIPERS
jgi:nicotinate-nucleotide adenylyltransferase